MIAVEGLTKHYPGVRAMTGASLEIGKGEVRALLGRNGAGKSTLIRVLSGVERADAGTVTVAGEQLGDGGVRRAAELGISTVHQELSLVAELSVAENLYLGRWPRRGGGIDYAAMRDGAAKVFARLGLDIDPSAPVGALSLAHRQLVEICRAVREQPRLLILDEPTSALAAAEVDIVLDTVTRIAADGVAVLYVSHRLEEIRRIAHTATVMRDGLVVETVDIAEADTSRIVSLMLGETTEAARKPQSRQVDTSETPLLSVRGLSVPPKVTDVSFDVHAGEVVGLGGLMGSGRTEVLRAIAGFDPAAAGTIVVEGREIARPTAAAMKRLGVGMTPEDRKDEGVVPLLGVDENLVLSKWDSVSSGATVRPGLVRRAATRLIERLSIATAAPRTPIVNLSGGNQQKAVIGRWLHAGSRILLLDEPTRGVDVHAKAEIYRLVRELAGTGAAIVFVSGELEELPLVCDRVLALREGRIAGELSGAQLTTESVLSAAMAA
ncbi:sugar ABC transporter ATP-binding protein [Amycolatopsis endophytica]|uniref:Simple sugar transport system ATP-binding protein n=1 Tax=Amycolatopsis endophytica TaxID=860233 RepID=A0A853B6E5_9PSEU|nr:sugar ABC transporter ATP-binding protein [Amycolatopsis endophytica]NYI90818.1 simple sugar transport system ATP-binding protein [Amycolatopsis endophytica]